MEEHWFDKLSKALLRAFHRREIVRATAAGAPALLFGAAGSDARRKNRKKGRGKKGRKSKRKNKDKNKPNQERCPDGREPCVLGLISVCCDASLTCCDELCVNLLDNDDHCNACDTPCSPGKVCFGGECLCRDGLELCGEICRDTQRDENFCGGCDMPPCTGDGMQCCDGTCFDTRVNGRHCGTCGNECSGPGGRCCDSSCVDSRFDDNHCGHFCRDCPSYAPQCCHRECINPEVAQCCRNHTSGPRACAFPQSCCINADGEEGCC